MIRRLPPIPAIALGIALPILLALPLGATLVLELNLAQLKERAATIVHGRCIAKREVPDGQPLPYTEYTFEVKKALRGCQDTQGKPLERITVRHAGTSQAETRGDGLEAAPRRWGIPEHQVGEEAILFLTKESSLGLCAPVGLDQGKLEVVQKDGRKLAINKRGKRLFESLDSKKFQTLNAAETAALESPGDALDLDCFLGLCAKLAPELKAE